MKRILPLLLWAFGISLSACTDVKQTEDYQSLLAMKEKLSDELQQQERQNQEIIRFVTQIEDNLAAVREREMGIVNAKNEPGLNQSERVTLIVAEIGTYFEENRNLLHQLEASVKAKDRKNRDLTKLVAMQKRQIREKEDQIKILLQTINDLNGKLESTITARNEAIQAKDQELSQVKEELTQTETRRTTAYYKAAPKKELLNKGVIAKEGGVLGIGKSVAVSTKLNSQTFIPLDIRSTTEIDLGRAKKQQLVSIHPRNTYYFEKTTNGATFLKITNPDQFWSVSRYLVVAVD